MGTMFAVADWGFGQSALTIGCILVGVILVVLHFRYSEIVNFNAVVIGVILIAGGPLGALFWAQDRADTLQSRKQVEAETQQAYADLARAGYPVPQELSVLEQRVKFVRTGCWFEFRLEEQYLHYVPVLFPHGAPISSDQFERLADLGCPKP